MKPKKKPEEGATFLLADTEDSIVEITCRSIFPNLEIFQLGLNKEVSEILTNDNIPRIILATTNKEIITKVLLFYEDNNVEVIPFLFTDADTEKLSEKTVIQIIHFEFFRLKFETLRSKTNFLMNSNLSNISETFENQNPSLESIRINPILFHSLLKAIESNCTKSFISFAHRVNDLCNQEDRKLIDELLLFLKETGKLDVIASLFSESIREFFNKDNFNEISPLLLSFIIGQANLLGKDLFKINRGWFKIMIFAISFDTLGTHKNIFLEIKNLNHKKNKFIDDISVLTFSTIFNNQNYNYKEFKIDKENQSKIEIMNTKSFLLFTNISNSKTKKPTLDKYELAIGFLDYIQYLLSDLKDDLMTPILKKYLNLNE